MTAIANLIKYLQTLSKLEPTVPTALVQAFVALGIAFQWWHWSSAQTGAVVGMAAVIMALIVRSQVVSVYALKELSGETTNLRRNP